MDLREFKVYKAFVAGSAKEFIAYRANIMMSIIGRLIMVCVTYFLWEAIYRSSGEGIIKGFTLNEMLTYVMITFLIGGIVSNDISFFISRDVRSGSIAMNLIKPINYRRRVLASGIGAFLMAFLFLFLPGSIGIGIFATVKGVNITFLSQILTVISIFLGFLINAYFSYLFGLLAFKFYNLWGISQIIDGIVMLVSGALVPLTFFPEVIRNIFALLPFSSIIYTPAMIYLNKMTTFEIFKSMGIQIFWIVIFIILSKAMWNKVIDKLTIQGG